MKVTSMSALMGLFYACLVITAASMNRLVGAARLFEVGDEFGWQEPKENSTRAVYNLWATRNRFQVGDSLSFEYKNDSVIEVDKWGYYHCNSSKPISAFNNGHSVFKLDRPGPFYFISGTPNHCKNGQRLLVEVMSFHHHGSYSPPSIANPPESYLGPSTNPSSGISLSVTFGSLSVLVATSVAFLCCAT